MRTELLKAPTGTVQDLADRSGLPEDRVRRHIVDEKRAGAADVWFDSRTGEMIQEHEPVKENTSQGTCPYCGFALRFEDRFCPYCGAPIKS